MFEETLARLRTHHKNVQRYRQLLETGLTDFEREYIGKRLSEEQAAIEALSADVALSGSLAQTPNGNPTLPFSAVIAESSI
jgi:5-bromo-4-chloroindolyl phosphate hydrolysis protein